MDKNGQNRGGARPGSGRKPKCNTVIELTGEKKPDIQVAEYLSRKQNNGSDFLAKQIYVEIYSWMKKNDFLAMVPDHLLQLYSVSVARWIQAEEQISKTGFIGRHPTTGSPITSPYVSISMEFSKQASYVWSQIYNIIKNNTHDEVAPEEPTNNLLALLGKAR